MALLKLTHEKGKGFIREFQVGLSFGRERHEKKKPKAKPPHHFR